MPPPLLSGRAVLIPRIPTHPNSLYACKCTRAFSTSLPRQKKRITLQRKRMLAWLRGPGKVFEKPLKGSTNYLSAYDKEGNLIRMSEEATKGGEMGVGNAKDEQEKSMTANRKGKGTEDDENEIPPETLEDLQPFPLNPFFRSPPVLSEGFRTEIYSRIVEQGQTIRQVSQDLGVDMSRVAAVVRLRKVENDWRRDGKSLALSFHKTIMDMLPQTKFDPAETRNISHESINDLPVHQATLPQIFHPAPEGQKFTRSDAGRVFHRGLLPAENRIPHPDMVETARDQIAGLPTPARTRAKFARWEEAERLMEEKEETARRKREEHETVVHGKRWDFKFERVHADKAVGWRYGMPLEDRKKGQVKIPTKVD